MTGEVERASFGYDPRVGRRVGPRVRVAEGGLRVRRDRLPPLPRPARPSASTAPSGPSRNAAPGRRPRPQDRPPRRRVPRPPARDAQRRRGLGARRAHRGGRDLSRALADARGDPQRAKQRMSKFLLRHGHVFDEPTPTGGRRATGRGRTGGGPTRSSSSSPTTPPPTSTTATACGAAGRRATRWRGGSPSPPGGRCGSRPWTRSGA